jgi:hypothetical protein
MESQGILILYLGIIGAIAIGAIVVLLRHRAKAAFTAMAAPRRRWWKIADGFKHLPPNHGFRFWRRAIVYSPFGESSCWTEGTNDPPTADDQTGTPLGGDGQPGWNYGIHWDADEFRAERPHLSPR